MRVEARNCGEMGTNLTAIADGVFGLPFGEKGNICPKKKKIIL